jgi:antitoxin HicB
MKCHNEDAPLPYPADGRPTVALPPPTAAKLELYRAWRAAGITKADLARRLGISPQHMQRLFDANHASRLDRIDGA